jgi:mannose-6-phosphate isomerase-like protein (cupin superfamily)
VAHRVTTIDALGPGVFRKLRHELAVTAFGVNAIVLPPGTEWFNHFHRRQDELYFVHAGKAGFEVGGDSFELDPGGVVYVETTTPRRFWNAGDDELVLLALGGRDGYVERDGEMVDPADVERRRRFSDGDLEMIRRRDPGRGSGS